MLGMIGFNAVIIWANRKKLDRVEQAYNKHLNSFHTKEVV